MSINVYQIGDLIKVANTFIDEDSGDLIDPFEVNFSFQTPSGVSDTLTYVTDIEVIKDSAGNYHVDLDANEAGMWRYRWHSTGAGQASDHGQFYVEGIVIVEPAP